MVKGGSTYSFERLVVWQEAMELARLVYQTTDKFPTNETYGIVAQIRRAAVSVPVNIAEGRGRYSKKEQIQFFYNARASLYEVVTFLQLSLQFGYFDQRRYSELDHACQRVLSKLSGLINSLKPSHPPSSTLHQSSPSTLHQSSPFTLDPSPTP